jgi:hypothetical protein
MRLRLSSEGSRARRSRSSTSRLAGNRCVIVIQILEALFLKCSIQMYLFLIEIILRTILPSPQIELSTRHKMIV